MVSLQAAIVAIALSNAGQTVLLDFYSDNCAPCRAMDPTIRALEAAGYPVQRVNVGLPQNRPLVERFQVQRWPCYVMVVSGQEVDRVVGGTTKYRLEQMCKRGMPSAPAGLLPGMLANNATAAPPAAAPSASFPPSNVVPAAAWTPEAPISPSINPAVKPVATVTDAALLSASVRLRVEDPTGHSCGSGTIIDARNGKALILTCGHIFRDSQGKGPIEVDLFGPTGQQRVAGQMYSYDLTRDVGLVIVDAPGPLAVAHVAPPGYPVKKGDSVASVGCNNGDVPSVRRSQINSLDKFQGPPNLQVAGQPVEGRSGGGLFSSEGYVIGVCNAADPSDREGLFAALPSIYTELDRKDASGRDLSFVYRSPNNNAVATDVAAAVVPVSASEPAAESRPSSVAVSGPDGRTRPEADVPARLSPVEQAALDEVHRRAKAGDEVTIIVHSRSNPNARSEVFILEHASSSFVRQVSAESRADSRRADRSWQETSLELPKPRKILLEWSANGDQQRAESQKAPN